MITEKEINEALAHVEETEDAKRFYILQYKTAKASIERHKKEITEASRWLKCIKEKEKQNENTLSI